MSVAFVATLALSASTMAGRILPLAREISNHTPVKIYAMAGSSPAPDGAAVTVQIVGREPFTRAPGGKIRLSGIWLIFRLLQNTFQTWVQLIKDKPAVVVIVKPLPQNTLAVTLARIWYKPKKIILDCDDFEVAANVLTSIWQRAAIHTSGRLALFIADACVAATPFLSDNANQLSGDKTPVFMVPTGIDGAFTVSQNQAKKIVYAGSVSVSSGHRVDMLPAIMQALSSRHPTVQLHIFGDGDDIRQVKKEAQARQVASSIIWHGRFSPPQLQQALSANTIVIDPIDASIVARAKSSYRCMVALASGLPVVTSNIGIRSRLIPQTLQPRFFALAGSPLSYAAAIGDLLDNPLSTEEKNTLQASAGQFTWISLSRQYWHILNS
ncbi:MAG: glycosyltransferase [Candidatus Andersenbacteria bacterium]|nr:glycosyltransferase [Candidatus Andersenbacteria bacterium]